MDTTRALPAYEVLANELKGLMPNCRISVDGKTSQISIFSSDTKINKVPANKIQEYGLRRLGVISKCVITERSGKVSTVFKKKSLPENLLRKDFEQAKYSFGAESIRQSKSTNGPDISKVSRVLIGKYYQVTKNNDGLFSDEFWNDLKRDLQLGIQDRH